MHLLVDTHAFLWLATEPELLSKDAAALIEDPDNTLFLSSISAWEIEQKYQLGKLKLPALPSSLVPLFREAYMLSALVFDEMSAFQLHKLPEIHNDPFDRMLICQAIQHNLTILTNDRMMQQYPVKTLW